MEDKCSKDMLALPVFFRKTYDIGVKGDKWEKEVEFRFGIESWILGSFSCRESYSQILNPYRQELRLQCFSSSWTSRFVFYWFLWILLIVDATYVLMGDHDNLAMHFQVESLKAKLLEKLEQFIDDLRPESRDISNASVDCDEPSKKGNFIDSVPSTAHQVSHQWTQNGIYILFSN